MRMGWNENAGRFVGEVLEAPALSHENHGERFYCFPLRICRLSGAEDVLAVIAGEGLLRRCPVRPGLRVEILGEVRSFNNKSGQGRKLVLSVFARALLPTVEEDGNEIQISGVLCKEPVYRRTPLGREICDLILAVNRRYGRADYLPCIAWGLLARQCAALDVGASLRLEGRFQSRAYWKNENGLRQRKVAYEVSIMTMLPLDERQLEC